MYIVPRTQKIHRCSEDRELNQARSRTDPIDRPVRTARATAHHYSGAQHCSTETALLIFSFLRTNITSQMWPSGGKGTVMTEQLLLLLVGHMDVLWWNCWKDQVGARYTGLPQPQLVTHCGGKHHELGNFRLKLHNWPPSKCTLYRHQVLWYWPVLVLPSSECICNMQISPNMFGLFNSRMFWLWRL